jgi:deoxycytidylate deaminase
MARDISEAINFAYAERNNLLVLALTGRTGSGCTTTAHTLSRPIDDIAISKEGVSPVEIRKLEIAQNFAKVQWVPFKILTVSTLIFSFLLSESDTDLETFLSGLLKGKRLPQSPAQTVASIQSSIASIKENSSFRAFDDLVRSHDLRDMPAAWDFYSGPLNEAAIHTKKILGSAYASVFQVLGDNIRKSGSALRTETDARQIFTLITRVKRLAKAAGRWDRAHSIESTRIVVDAVRNPLELVYLRDQFAAFYVIAITSDEVDRRARLSESGMTRKDIDALDKKEYSKKSLKTYDNFLSQNLQECIQKSDLFFHNNGTPADFERNRLELNRQVVRYVSLMLRPGLVTPTADERCMQLAFVAKLNSGCISRQVGAAITDAASSIKAVGWNDVPRGQIPCLLRDVGVLLSGHDPEAFSHYETTTTQFRAHLATEYSKSNMLRTATGLNCPFCFKDAYNAVMNEKNQVHTRSLHAEENAFLQLAKHGNSGIAGGQLFTTASPCELCSKKAYQLGIKEIVYVDPYPGISSTHILSSGQLSARPKLRLFGGAVGNAYHKLYEPVLPIKDELNARLSDDPPPTLI